MNAERAKRKLSGILSADAVGYSRLMQEDEASTIRTIEDSRKLMFELIEQFNGRVVDAPGDNLLAEFGSVVDATECAVKIQKELKTKNAELPDNRKMEFRVGVNLGDVVEEAGRIYGDGVNIAARLEGLADPGGICISRTAYDHVKNKLRFGYEYLGEHSVKNISGPVRVYRVLMEPESAGKVIGEKRTLGGIPRKMAMFVIIALVILAGCLIAWNIYLHQSKKIEPASLDRMAYPLPDKPSIAVLAFDNLSGDPEQDYFCDGIAEEIITALSKAKELFVIARNSSFSYKGKPVRVQQVSEELGVRYVLEGSVRKSSNRIRITAQLIDAIKGQHLWADRYERDLKDIFKIQDEITQKIVTALRVKLTEGEQARILSQKYDLDVYLKIMEAQSLWREGNKESYQRFSQLAQEIVDMAPEAPAGYRLLAWYNRNLYAQGISPKENFKKAFEFAQKAISLDESDSFSHALLSAMYVYMRKYEKAIEAGKRSIELDPNSAYLHGIYGITLAYADSIDEAIDHFKYAIRLNPFPPYWYYYYLGMCYRMKGQYEKALAECKKALQQSPNAIIVHVGLAALYILLDQEEEARAEAAKVMELDPNFSLSYLSTAPFKNQAHLKLLVDASKKAGLK